ncbi:MAG: ATP-binding cassette domain-containing protein [Defluviitaleaceae bacterium]|nr:ATP-binding cassette domain-containing protein [Defluviitaleaceae bacterium]
MLEIKNASLTFNPGTVNEQPGLNQLSLTVESGEFVTIIGSNGAGKSTLFNCIGGVYELDEGLILLDGTDITYMPEHRRSASIGRIFQNPLKGTAPDMTIEENLSLAFYSTKTNPFSMGVKKKGAAMFRERLAEFGMGLEDRMKQKMGLLSGGQRQAVSLLMAVIGNPKLLLLDEHTAALDPEAAEKVMHITKKVIREHKFAAMMITHNLPSALDAGTRTIMLDAGKVGVDLVGEVRDRTTVEDLMRMYSL